MMEEASAVARSIPGITVVRLPNCSSWCGCEYPLPSKRDEEKAWETLKKLAINQNVGELPLPQVDITLEGDSLSMSLHMPLERGTYWSRLDILKDGKLYERLTNTLSDEVYQMTLTEPGVYLVRAHVSHLGRSEYACSETVFFADEEINREFDRFCDSVRSREGELGTGLFYAEEREPFCDFIVISWRTDQDAFDFQPLQRKLTATHKSFKVFPIGSYGSQTAVVVTNGDVVKKGDLSVLLSGKIMIGGRLIESGNELPDSLPPEQLNSALGEYSALFWNEKRVSISHELFGYNQLYYYGTDLTIISNNYLLTLETAFLAERELTLNINKITATLSSPGFQVLLQNYSHEMDVSPIKKIPMTEDPLLTADGWSTVQNGTYAVLAAHETYHEERYRRLLHKAIQELRGTISAYMQRDHQYTLPLTGGMDSRLLLSSYLGIKNPYRRLYVDCWDMQTEGGKKDSLIGTSIAGYFHCQYDELPALIKLTNIYEEDARNRGGRDGVYYSMFGTGLKGVMLDHVQEKFYGAGGEIATRPYVSARYFDAPLSMQTDIDSLSEFIVRHMLHNVITGDSKEYFSAFQKGWVEAMKALPAMSPYEMIDRHYMEFRHGTHFAKQFSYNVSLPLQSKTLLRLHHMTFDVFRSIKLNFDLLYLANAEAAQFPFEDDKRNTAREDLFEDLVIRDCSLPKVDTTLGKDLERWRASRVRRSSARKAIGSHSLTPAMTKEQLYRESSISILQKLVQNIPEMSGEFGKALWYSINYRGILAYDMQYLYRKLASVWDQYKLLHGKDITVIDQNYSWEEQA